MERRLTLLSFCTSRPYEPMMTPTGRMKQVVKKVMI